MGIRVLTSRLIRESLDEAGLQLLAEKFRAYKRSGDPGGYFGRDFPLERPRSALDAELMHVHLNTGQRWNFRLIQFRHVSNAFLIYCSGYFDKECYLLIELLAEDAHERCDNLLYVAQLADIAADFRKRF